MASVVRENNARLLSAGLHEIGGFVFSTGRVPVSDDATGLARDIARERAEIEAMQGLVRSRSASESLPEGIPDRLRLACAAAASRCRDSVDAVVSGAKTVLEADVDGYVVLVLGLSRTAFEKVETASVDLRHCLRSGASRCGLSVLESLLLLEIDDGDVAEAWRQVKPCLRTKLGWGIELMSNGCWDVGSPSECAEAVELWIPSLASAAIGTDGLSKGALPVDASALRSLSIEELLAFAGHRANDPAIREHLRERLVAMGYVRSAALLAGPGVPLAAPFDHSGSRLEPTIRVKVVSIPVIALSLLSGGTASWSTASGPAAEPMPELDEALRAGDVSRVQTAVAALAEELRKAPDVPGLVALGGALRAMDDPGLAFAAFAAAGRVAPRDVSAALGTIQSLRMLGQREAARAKIARLRADPLPMDDGQLAIVADIERWSAPES